MIIDNLDQLKSLAPKCVMLFSGGLDSSYFLLWATQNNIDVVPVYTHLGPGKCPTIEDFPMVTELGRELIIDDMAERLATDFIAQGIRATTYYQELFPVCSTFSRPLIAKRAIEIAHEHGATCVVHSAGFHQNSGARFNNSVNYLDPSIMIGTPFLKSDLSREEKMEYLNQHGYKKKSQIYSIDENIWGRVIENGELDDFSYPVPEHVFGWTNHETIQTTPHDFTLTFEEGLPVAYNGERMNLVEMLAVLNAIGGKYNIGRYNNLEDTFLVLKNHEVREAPAAEILHLAKKTLEQSIFTKPEIQVKKYLDNQWIDLAVSGFWFSPLKLSIDEFMNSLCKNLNGDVYVRLYQGRPFISGVKSDRVLDFHGASETAKEQIHNISYKELFEVTQSMLQ
jgi:argininosuccinate synthase